MGAGTPQESRHEAAPQAAVTVPREEVIPERLRVIFESATDWREGSRVAVDHAQRLGVERFGVRVPLHWICRRYKDQPLPLLARVLPTHSAIALPMLTLCFLWDVPPDTKDAPWELALCVERGARRGPSRRIATAQRSITECWEQFRLEYKEWSDRGTHGEDAWRTIHWRKEVFLPLTLWSNGWYLALAKDELAWLMAHQVFGKIQGAMRPNLFGFREFVEGLEMGRSAASGLGSEAPAYLARMYLSRLWHGGERFWPHFDFQTGELPQRVFTAEDEDQRRSVIVETDVRLLVYERSTREEFAKGSDWWLPPDVYQTPIGRDGGRGYEVRFDSQDASLALIATRSSPSGNVGQLRAWVNVVEIS